jgi:hydroxypyruvate isomerase
MMMLIFRRYQGGGNMKMSVCVDALWPQIPCEDAAQLAAGCGAQAIEFWGWWDKNLLAVKKACDNCGLDIAAICTRFLSLVDGHELEAYLQGLKETIDAARELHCRTIISQVGNELIGVPYEEQRLQLLDGLRKAVELISSHDVQLVIEPLNTRVDHKGYFLWSSSEAAQIVREVNSPQVKMLFDIYHQQIMEGDILQHIRENLHCIGHMHCAGVPGRHSLSESELDYRYVFKAVDEMGYDGFMGLELFTGTPEEEIRNWCGKRSL